MPKRFKDQKFVVFVDIRGFTKWSESIYVFNYVEKFIDDFRKSIVGAFSFAETKKPLGDGMMLAGSYSSETLEGILRAIKTCSDDFDEIMRRYSDDIGRTVDLSLGWGVARGLVRVLGKDILGHTVNRASRLCDIARPFGVVIDAENFPEIPISPYRFTRKTRIISGIDSKVSVWVTDEIAQQFVGREFLREQPEVHVAGVCVKISDHGPSVLLAKRNEDRAIFGGKYEGCGGQLAANETFTDGVKRHYLLEMGIEVEPVESVHCFYLISEPNIARIPGIRFACKYVSGSPSSSRHSEIKWVSIEELKNMPDSEFVPGLKSEAESLVEQLHKELN